MINSRNGFQPTIDRYSAGQGVYTISSSPHTMKEAPYHFSNKEAEAQRN